MQHSFDIETAQKYGIEIAIFIKHISYWVAHNKANRKNCHNEKYWTYNSLEAFTELFPYWSKSQIKRLIAKTIDHGLIIKDKFNENPYDHTPWYSLTDLGETISPLPLGRNRPDDVTESSRLHGTKSSRLHTDVKQDIKPERARKNQRAPLSPFYPNEQSTLLCKDLGLNLQEEIDSFNNRHKWDKTDYEFSRWLKSSKEYKEKTKIPTITATSSRETKSTVMEYGPGHPSWEANKQWELKHGREAGRDRIGSQSVRKASECVSLGG